MRTQATDVHERVSLTPEASAGEWRAFVGDNADYYTARWARLAEGSGHFLGFNHAAAWLSPSWLAYRRMYAWSALEVAGIAIMRLTLRITFGAAARHDLGVAAGLEFLNVLIYLAAAVVVGSLGTYWYYVSASRAVAQARLTASTPQERRAHLRNVGGTNLLMAFVFPLIAALPWGILAGFLALIGIPV